MLNSFSQRDSQGIANVRSSLKADLLAQQACPLRARSEYANFGLRVYEC